MDSFQGMLEGRHIPSEAMQLCLEIEDELKHIRCVIEDMNETAVAMKLQVLVMENRLLALPEKLRKRLTAAEE